MAPRPRVDGRSLVDPALHSPALEEMLQADLSRPLIDYVVARVVDVVDYALCRPSTSARRRSSAHARAEESFAAFAGTVIQRAGMGLPVVLGTLVYLDRARPHLQLSLEEWACERVFLGALICANKYLNDSTLKNVHWSLCTGLFNKRDVGRIEREFLDVLDFELRVAEEDLLAHYAAVTALQHPHPHPHPPARKRASVPTRRASAASSTSSSAFSSESGSDSESESESESPGSSLPTTPPAPPLAQDRTAVRASSCKDGDRAHRSPQIASSPAAAQRAKDGPRLRRDHSSRRASSGFSILRSIHVPHFHSGAPS